MVKKKVLTVFFFTRGSQWKTNATPSFHSCLTGGKIAFVFFRQTYGIFMGHHLPLTWQPGSVSYT